MPDAITRYTANNGPSKEYVAIIESTPDVGVEMRNESIAPLLAPFLCNISEVGITPHEHNGKGIPRRAAFTTERIFPFPKCLDIVSTLRKTWSSPAKKKPNKRYGLISPKSFADSSRTPLIKLIIGMVSSLSRILSSKKAQSSFSKVHFVFRTHDKEGAFV
jgi:hypothetical protein